MKRFFIGDIAKRFGLNPRTIRYYEIIGILPKARRTESGYRIYSYETIERLEFILKAKALGLKLVKKLSCPSCDVKVYDLKKEGMDVAKKYGVNSVPTVVVDGKIAECCVRGKPTEADLKMAGIGSLL